MATSTPSEPIIPKGPGDYLAPQVLKDPELSMPEKILTMAKDYAIGAIKGVSTDLAGTPVDLINLLVSPATRALGIYSDNPTGGSKDLRERAGVGVEDANLRETVGNLLTPGGAAHAMIVAASRVGRDVPGAVKMMDDLVAQGTSVKEAQGRAFAATGVYFDTDKTGAHVPKTIISDQFAGVKVGTGLDINYNPTSGASILKAQKSPVPLPDVIYHPELFQAYPELKNVKVQAEDMKGYKGSFTPYTGLFDPLHPGRIRLAPGDPEAVRSTLLHEIQHAVQRIENFKGGSNVDANKKFTQGARNKLQELTAEVNSGKHLTPEETTALTNFIDRYNLDNKRAQVKYLNTAGEQEARFTQATKDMDQQEAGAKLLELIRSGRTPTTVFTKPLPTK